MKDWIFEITAITPSKTYGRWGYKDIHDIHREVIRLHMDDLIVDVDRDFPDFIERWEDIVSEAISDRIDDLYPPDENIQKYHTPGHITYVFDCDLYRGDELISRYHVLSSFTGEKDIKDILTREWKIWRREKRLEDLGL